MPNCSAKPRGQFWPPEANQDRGLLLKLARLGELHMCTRGAWRYRWESPTVHVSQLAKGGGHMPRIADHAALSTPNSE
jgi:hypothetical protein